MLNPRPLNPLASAHSPWAFRFRKWGEIRCSLALPVLSPWWLPLSCAYRSVPARDIAGKWSWRVT